MTQDGLWVVHRCNPTWLQAELAAMEPGTVQSNIFSWNKRLSRHFKNKEYRKTIDLFKQMEQEGMVPDKYTYVPVLNSCSSLRALEEGKSVHLQVLQTEHESDVYVGSCLVDMYAKCGSIEDANRVFAKISTRDVFSWNAMIMGCVKCGQMQKALDLFHEMKLEGVDPTPMTFVGVLNACGSLEELEVGYQIHKEIERRGFLSNLSVGGALVDMYAKCGSITDAWRVFNMIPTKTVVSWNAMIQGSVRCGNGQKALDIFQKMQKENIVLDRSTFVAALNACSSLMSLERGRNIHEQIIQTGYDSDIFVGSALVDMYAKCGSIEDASRVFNNMPTRNVVSWTAMIVGFVNSGQAQMALELFHEMQQKRVDPDAVTFVGVLKACAKVAALEEGHCIHKQIVERGYESNIIVGNCLVDMYAKCGSLVDAQRVFDKMPSRDVVSWNAMLGAYAMHGFAEEALKHFEEMSQELIQVNAITFVSLLSACSHGRLVDEGLHYFESISSVYSTSVTVDHYSCMVALLGRAGRLHEAEDLIEMMCCEPNASVWMSLLGACTIHGQVEMGETAAKRFLDLDPENVAGYVLLSNIYAASGQWENSAAIKQQRLERGLKKIPGVTWIEVNRKVHTFLVDDNEHPQIEEIHEELARLSVQMKEGGYVPDTELVLHDIEEDKKLVHLCHHSEKLAIAYGLISTPPGTVIRIFKNLRVCRDCHTATKVITNATGRAIIVRDTTRFHHFQNGQCSCRDYW